MSAFIVEDKTINAIVTFTSASHHHTHLKYLIEREIGVDVSTSEGKRDFAQAILDLNFKAVNARYNESDGGEIRFQRVDGYTAPKICKALDCLLYQCSEGDAPETKIFKLIAAIHYDIMKGIIRENAEYEQAAWH